MAELADALDLGDATHVTNCSKQPKNRVFLVLLRPKTWQRCTIHLSVLVSAVDVTGVKR